MTHSGLTVQTLQVNVGDSKGPAIPVASLDPLQAYQMAVVIDEAEKMLRSIGYGQEGQPLLTMLASLIDDYKNS